MKVKTNICESCGVVNNQTHLHHIVPKSKGGSDRSGNLIEVCHPCHQKIHNTEFSGESGLIKSGLIKSKQNTTKAIDFMSINHDILLTFFENFSDEYETEVLHEIFRFGAITASDFIKMLKGEKIKNSYGDITNMVNVFYTQNKDQYKFIF